MLSADWNCYVADRGNKYVYCKLSTNATFEYAPAPIKIGILSDVQNLSNEANSPNPRPKKRISMNIKEFKEQNNDSNETENIDCLDKFDKDSASGRNIQF
ncbi:hypothetical protein [Legionella gresilensis]|uniref:hypothetical protein n=1 Tax=Legionella gresilensis TaxID=91823 RepID=UPI0013EF97CE|nr:hypothetical protein [Legionella gresilensis]